MRLVLAAALATVALSCAAASASTRSYPGFRTPSKNIACAAFAPPRRYLRCDILSGVRPTPHGRCELDWTGYGANLHGRAFATCAGDTVAGLNPHVLAYGRTWYALGFTCVSRLTGLTCRNADKHGFFMSRAHSYRF
jgi:eukaryotic-like serine/threonine-protein kinase